MWFLEIVFVEDKDLLLKDLCARLPYGVKIDVTYSKESGSSLRSRLCSEEINVLDTNILWLFQQSEIYIKPYLFPLSSMTEEQKEEIEDKLIFPSNSNGGWVEILYNDKYEIPFWLIDFCNKNHFDYRGLIHMDLAIDATNLNIY